MSDFIHQSLAGGRWYELSLAEQLGNVGSEMGRAVNWNKKGNFIQGGKALDRALDLLDLTVMDDRWHKGRKELCRVREVIKDTFLGDGQYDDKPESLEKYFYYYALEARRNK